jgi:Arc/MetJ-type ribon-helix-helix transcriptional regulator
VATMNVSLPDAMKAWVERQAEGERYGNASDYIRDLIRKDQEQGGARSGSGGCRRGDRERRSAGFRRGNIQAAHEGAVWRPVRLDNTDVSIIRLLGGRQDWVSVLKAADL